MSVQYPWVLLLLPLTLLPLLARRRSLRYSALSMIPPDRLSQLLGWTLRLIGFLAIAALVVALSQPYRLPQSVERIGQGAQMALLLDRSRSMDQPFGSGRMSPAEASAKIGSKGKVARRLLSEFVARRRNDLFGMLAFSTFPIQILPLTDKQTILQAAISAGNLGRGLSETNVGAGLLSALQFFEDRPFTGSRIVLLVSDGGARLGLETQIQLKNRFRRVHAALYWIYIRSYNSPGLGDGDGDDASGTEAKSIYEETAPERALHRFFQDMGTPYRVYTAENPDALQEAIADVSRLQNLPIYYQALVPRRDLTQYSYGLATVLIALLVLARLFEIKAWH